MLKLAISALKIKPFRLSIDSRKDNNDRSEHGKNPALAQIEGAVDR